MVSGGASVVGVTYHDVMVTTEQLDLARPVEAAAAVDAINDRLAGERNVPPEVATEVAGLAAAVRSTPLERWIAADPYLALLVHRAVLDAQAAVDDAAREGPAAAPNNPAREGSLNSAREGPAAAPVNPARDALRIALERLSHALSALGEAEEVGDARSPKELARWLVAAVEVPQRDIADLLGVDLRRFQRWISARERTRPEGEEARRLRALARLVGQLRHSFTPAGVVAWFDWPSPELGGATPRELLADPVRLPDLLLAAGSTRSTAFA